MSTTEQDVAAITTMRQREHAETLLDDALRETFPASDPVSVYVPPVRDARAWT